MKRYVWTRRGKVFHQRGLATEQCCRSSMVGRIEGDVPPPGRRLCDHCRRKGAWLIAMGQQVE